MFVVICYLSVPAGFGQSRSLWRIVAWSKLPLRALAASKSEFLRPSIRRMGLLSKPIDKFASQMAFFVIYYLPSLSPSLSIVFSCTQTKSSKFILNFRVQSLSVVSTHVAETTCAWYNVAALTLVSGQLKLSYQIYRNCVLAVLYSWGLAKVSKINPYCQFCMTH